MHINTERLILRSFRLDDTARFVSMHADTEVMQYLGGPLSKHQSESELKEIMKVEAETGLIRFAIERQAAPGLIGYCGLKPAGDFVDLSYVISKEHWGHGYALEAARCVREFGRIELQLTNMEAGGAADNVASIKILEHLNFSNREELIFNNRPAIRFFD